MASFNGNINLLALKQAVLRSNIDEKNPSRGYVCIPVDLNDIKVVGERANLRVSMRPIYDPQTTLNNINAKRIQRGDNPMTLADLHTHTMDIQYSDEFVAACIKQFGQPLIDKCLATIKKEDKKARLMTQDANDKNSELFRQLKYFMQFKLADMYQYREQTQQTALPAYAAASAPTAYVAPADDNYFAGNYSEDLPF